MARIYQCYHKHSDWTNPTITDSVATLKDYALRAKELGHSIISSCEHGTQGNYRMCYELAKEHGLRWRYVTEAYFVKDRNESDRTNSHMILAAKTAKGVGDLNFALSEANISGFYFHPRLDLDLLSTLSPNDVFITTACVGGVFKYGLEEAERLICWLHAHFKDSFMLEVQANNTEKQKEINRFLLSMYRKYGIPLIAGTDSHMIHPEEAQLRTMRLEANGLHYDDEDGWDMDYPDGDELYRRFMEQGGLSPAQIEEAISNTNIFLTFEDIEFDKSKKLPNPLFPYLSQEERNQKYRDLVYAAWEKFSVGMTEEQKKPYLEAIEYEVNTITSTNTSDYFLIDYYMVKEAKANGGVITRTGRGSGASYFTNTLLGFSSIDRLAIPVTMYPDRFISADRLASGSLPDLDLNVANEEVFETAQAKIMGEWHSARMVAFGKLKLLSAWKMYCRAANVPYGTANEMADHLRRYETDLRHADEEEAEDMNVYDYIPQEFHAIFDMSEKYQGMIERISPSPCSYVLCSEDVRREFGLIRLTTKTGTKKTIFAAYIDGATAERFGYLKNDILHVDVVKLNEAIYSAIGMKQPTVKELLAMCPPSDDAWKMYDRGLTMGLNQVERDKSTEKAMRYRPRNISEMSALVAGIRPSFQSLINTLLDRKRFVYDIPALDNLLQTREMPNSFILYQEQLMAILQYGGFTPPESYAAIKAIAKKHPEKVLPLKEKFLIGFLNKLLVAGTKEERAKDATEKVWGIISDACGYGFNACVSGETKIMRSQNGKKFVPTIAEMHRIRHDREYARDTRHLDLHKKYVAHGYGKALSLCKDGRIRENTIKDIYYQGERPVFALTTASGRVVTCTDNHKFPVAPTGELVQLKDLCPGDALYFVGEREKRQACHRYSYEGSNNLPIKGQRGFQKKAFAGSEIFKATRSSCVANALPCSRCGVIYSADGHFELHHADGDSTNNDPNNFLWLCNSCHKVEHYRHHARVKRYEYGVPAIEDPIVSIQQVGVTEVYDVEMEGSNHNFAIDNGMIVGNSHSVAVALDSLYTAWAKAHYPLETYATLLQIYAAKDDKDRIMKARVEMDKGFGIRMVPCKFREDNRSFRIDKEHMTISDALFSCKHISKRNAEALWRMRDNLYFNFVEVLQDLLWDPAFNARQIKALITMGYFSEFGGAKKLLKIFEQFEKGKDRITKSLKDATTLKRINALIALEESLPDEELPLPELLSFEAVHYGAPMTVDKMARSTYVVMEVDDKFSPKIKLYSAATGRVGVMKIKKPIFSKAPLRKGDVIDLLNWVKRPAYRYVDGKSKAIPGVDESWIVAYDVLWKAVDEKEAKEVKAS